MFPGSLKESLPIKGSFMRMTIPEPGRDHRILPLVNMRPKFLHQSSGACGEKGVGVFRKLFFKHVECLDYNLYISTSGNYNGCHVRSSLERSLAQPVGFPTEPIYSQR